MRRFRVCERSPLPQDFEQLDQAPQLPHLQFTGQLMPLHEVLSWLSPSHSVPPKAAATFLARVRTVVPLPQVLEHLPQLPHVAQTQCTGQFWVLQVLFSSQGPEQFLPPCFATVAMPRSRTERPPPQERWHSDQGPQVAHSQSTGQGCELHFVSSLSVPTQSLPPHCAMTTFARVRSLVPPPQVLAQRVQAPQLPHLHWTAQFLYLHWTICLWLPTHFLPLFLASTLTFRSRLVWPQPQVSEQAW
mmetsp:Transcript_80436/g.179966  ORF Transcript_80436/g.179966 Transcript_80436/m.179966 type:complete len:245 (+) Transcript_80436:1875-2609(+)